MGHKLQPGLPPRGHSLNTSLFEAAPTSPPCVLLLPIFLPFLGRQVFQIRPPTLTDYFELGDGACELPRPVSFGRHQSAHPPSHLPPLDPQIPRRSTPALEAYPVIHCLHSPLQLCTQHDPNAVRTPKGPKSSRETNTPRSGEMAWKY